MYATMSLGYCGAVEALAEGPLPATATPVGEEADGSADGVPPALQPASRNSAAAPTTRAVVRVRMRFDYAGARVKPAYALVSRVCVSRQQLSTKDVQDRSARRG